MSADTDHDWMGLALEWARRGADQGDVPVGAVVVRDDEVLGAAHDGKEIHKDPTAHAEVLALREACAKVGDWRLDGATLYVTLEPCPMCAGALIHARVARLVFGARNPRWGACGSEVNLLAPGMWNHRIEVVEGIRADESAEILRETFRKYRKG